MVTNKNIQKVVLLGASIITGNLGVSALAWSSVYLIKQRWPEAQIWILGGRERRDDKLEIGGLLYNIETYPVRYCKNIFVKNHIWKLLIGATFRRVIGNHLRKTKSKNQIINYKSSVANKKSTLEALLNADLICDITGGDSFSDIYGMARFAKGYLLKRTCQMTNSPFFMLPQTYGPFTSVPARVLARQILNHTQSIYSRDREGLAVVQELIGFSSKVKLCPDVAFVMEAIRPDTARTDQIEQLKAAGKRLVGLNISGLLYNGGYTRKNMFGLACDYPALVRDIISCFAGPTDQYVLLVPHVVPPAYAVEDDLAATKEALKTLPVELQDKVLVMEGVLDQNKTKYLIGLCDFFLGARMHATIAALSQGVPAVGMAYSRKFVGVFETAGVADCVLDLRLLNNEKVMDGIGKIFVRREELRAVLENTVPKLKNNLFHLFDGLNGSSEKPSSPSEYCSRKFL